MEDDVAWVYEKNMKRCKWYAFLVGKKQIGDR